jgi:phosphate transport system substrate-binding protein
MSQRRVGLLILIVLLIHPIMLFAQDDSAVTAVGSGIPAPLLQEFATLASVTLNLTVTGTDNGFAAFCRGEADITTATRAISVDEETACAETGVSFLEFVLGYDIMAVIASPSSDFGTCLTTDQLNALFAPSSDSTNWNQVDAENADIPLSFYVPPDNTATFALLDNLVEGVGLRSDVNILPDDTAITDAVSTTPGAIGVVSLPNAQLAQDSVTILDLSTTSAGCSPPSPETVQGRTYTGRISTVCLRQHCPTGSSQAIVRRCF